MQTINQIQDEIIEDFSVFDEWLDKYEYLIEIGRDLPQIQEKFKIDDFVISGCQSQVWLHADFDDGKINFTADSDAIITKGIISLLLKILNNRTPKEIINSDVYFIKKIGLQENLSPTRANGLFAMLKQIEIYAQAYNKKLDIGMQDFREGKIYTNEEIKKDVARW